MRAKIVRLGGLVVLAIRLLATNVNFLTDLCNSSLGQQGRLDMGSMDFLGRVLITILAKAMKRTHDDFPVVCCRDTGKVIRQTYLDL